MHYLPGTSYEPCASSSTAPYAAGFTLAYGQGCNIAQALMYITTLLLRPTFPILSRTLSIKEGIVNDLDVLGDVELSLFHSWCHPQLVPPWVEVCLH